MLMKMWNIFPEGCDSVIADCSIREFYVGCIFYSNNLFNRPFPGQCCGCNKH